MFTSPDLEKPYQDQCRKDLEHDEKVDALVEKMIDDLASDTEECDELVYDYQPQLDGKLFAARIVNLIALNATRSAFGPSDAELPEKLRSLLRRTLANIAESRVED